MSELTKIVERTIERSRPIAVSSLVAFSPCDHSSPEMNVVAFATASRSFEHKLHSRVERLRTALEPVPRRAVQRGAWTVNGQTPVTERVLEVFTSAEEEIVYMTVEDRLTENLVGRLVEVADREVSIQLADDSAEVQDRIREAIPAATMFESLRVWSDTPAGRLMLVDGRKTLVSTLVNGMDASPSDPRSETAIWSEDETNSLAVVLKAVFT